MTNHYFSGASYTSGFVRSELNRSDDVDPFSLWCSGAILLAVVFSALIALFSFIAS
jgi:hypothetical protein